MLNFSTKSFILENGERYCLLVDKESGDPLFYPNLFITSQIRQDSSYSTMVAKFNAITVFLRFLDENEINLEDRIYKKAFFETFELDALRDFCQLNLKMRDAKPSKVTKFHKKHTNENRVTSNTVYMRLTDIAKYFGWLADYLLKNNKQESDSIQRVIKGLKARRPVKKNRNINSKQEEKSLNKKDIEFVNEVFRIDSELNPFKSHSLKVRNNLMFKLLFHLGLRGGELLNIRIQDIDFSSNQLLIPRRADEKDDPRTYQPLVKTLDRRLPLKDTLIEEIRLYITKYRNKVPNAKVHDFLFITHKSGPTIGQPISKSGYKKVINVVREISPELAGFHAHKLRHTWNNQFSELLDELDKPRSLEEQENIRSYLMGWKPGSGTAAIYNSRFVKNKAEEAALKLQENMIVISTEANEDEK